jgi:nitrogen fixation NifU-like protein
MQVEQMYQEIILDHYRNPQGKGLREPFEVEVHHINPTCGDEVTLRVRVVQGDEQSAGGGEPTVEFSYDGTGCSISQASESVMFEQLNGATVSVGMAAVDEFLELLQAGSHGYTPDEDVLGDAVAFSGVAKYPARVKCALLGWMAWKDAVAQALAGRVTDSAKEQQS